MPRQAPGRVPPVREVVERLSEAVNRAVEVVAMAVVGVMVAVVAFGVASRFFLRAPVAWSDELSRYLFVWLSFLGAAVALRRGMHVGVDVLAKRLPSPTQSWLRKVTTAMVLVFLLVVTVAGLQLALFASAQRSPAMRISMLWPYLAVPVGAGLMALYVLGGVPEVRRSEDDGL